MLSRIAICVSFFEAALAIAEEVPPNPVTFDPHLSGNPYTVGHGKVNYESFPGSSLRQRTLLGSTLAVGIGNSIEVGTVPVFYVFHLIGAESYNATLKYNFLRTEQTAFAIGYTTQFIRMRMKNNEGSSDIENGQTVKIWQHGLGLFSAFSYSSQLAFGVTVTGNYLEAQTKSIVDQPKQLTSAFHEEVIDASYVVNDRWTLSSGISRTLVREAEIGKNLEQQQYEFGVGTSATCHRPETFFSKPAFGIHWFTQSKRAELLLSTTFW